MTVQNFGPRTWPAGGANPVHLSYHIYGANSGATYVWDGARGILPAARYGRIKVGDTLTVRAEAPFTGSYKATVKVVDPLVDSASGTFGVRLEVPNTNQDMLIGIRCSVEF